MGILFLKQKNGTVGISFSGTVSDLVVKYLIYFFRKAAFLTNVFHPNAINRATNVMASDKGTASHSPALPTNVGSNRKAGTSRMQLRSSMKKAAARERSML